MSRKAQSRIIIDAIERKVLLASVRENPSGSLVISLSKAKLNFGSDGIRRKTIGQKYTVHTGTRGSETNTIHHTLLTESQPSQESYIVTHAISSGLVEIIYSQTMRWVPPSLKAEPREKDQVFSIGSYLPSHSTLHYVMLVAPPGANKNVIEESPFFERHVFNFRCFSIVFASAFSILPSCDDGFLMHRATAPLSIGGRSPHV